MLDLDAADFVWIGSVLRHLAMEMQGRSELLPLTTEHAQVIVRTLNEVAARCELLELSVSKETVKHWETEFKDLEPPIKFIQAKAAIEEIERTIKHELGDMPLYFLPKERMLEGERMLKEVRELWEKPWPIVLENLDDARFCYGFDQFTASVFHSMRAAEPILTSLARSLANVDPSREQWQTLIERIESAIKEFDKLPKGPDRDKKQAAYSDIAMQFRYLKNAWRNHVMHSRGDYKERDAREIWWHVKRSLEKTIKELPELQET